MHCIWLQVLGRRYGTLDFKLATDVREVRRHGENLALRVLQQTQRCA